MNGSPTLGVLTKMERRLERESRVYGGITIVLSFLDILAGAVCAVCTTLQFAALVTSLMSGAVVCSRAVQILRTKKFVSALKVLSGVSSAYLDLRKIYIKGGGTKMNTFLQAIKNNPLTILFALFGAGIMFYVGYFFAGIWFAFGTLGSILCGALCAVVAVVLVVLLGWDKAKAAILRGAKKALSAEAYDTLVNVATALEAEETAAKAEAEAAKAEMQQKAEQEAYIHAKQLVEKYEASKAAANTDSE